MLQVGALITSSGKVPVRIRRWRVPPRSTKAAAGVVGSKPWRASPSASNGNVWTPIYTANVAPERASAAKSRSSVPILGVAGHERDGSALVPMGQRDRCVGGTGERRGDARHDLERDAGGGQASAASPPRPKISGSPPFSRATHLPSCARRTSSALISCCDMQ